MKRTKVFFIVPYPSEGASNRLRVEQYLPYLEKEGISYRIRPFAGRRFYKILYVRGRHFAKVVFFLLAVINRLLDVARALAYDVIFIHREALPIGSVFVESALSRVGKRIVFDFDDAIFLPNTSKSNNYIERFKNPNKASRTIALCDTVIAGNRYLEEYARKFNDNVVVIPTPIDTDRYTPGPRHEKDRVTIGWVGSFTTRTYLDILKKVFQSLMTKYPGLKLKFIGNWSELTDRIGGAEYKEWSLDDELDDIRSFDIGIMPIPDDMWTRGKCGFKLILYMACGLPVITSPVGMNREIIKDGENGFFAGSEAQWQERLSALIEDGSLRDRIGRSGRKTVEERYSVERTAPDFIRAVGRG